MLRWSSRPLVTSVALPSSLAPPGSVSLPEAYNLLAALMQLLGMLLLTVGILLMSWVWVEPKSTFLGPPPFVVYTLGFPYKMNVSRNSSDILYFFSKEPHEIKVAMIMLCFLNLCCGFMAFLLDFLQIQMLEKYWIRLIPSLHLFSGMICLILILICAWCFGEISQQFTEAEWDNYPMKIHFGESFYIALLVFVLALLAVIFILCTIWLNVKQKWPSKALDAKP